MSLIEFQLTPNPDALRVLPGRQVSAGPARQFDKGGKGTEPLAGELLAIEGITRVMLGPDFVTVVRQGPASPWELLRPQIVLALADAFERGIDCGPQETPADQPQLGEIEQQIEDVLDRWVRPMLAADGGEAVFVRFDARDGTAWVRMEGACGGCPSGSTTLKRGIEQTIRRWVPEVSRVLQVESAPASRADPKARFRDWVARKWGS